MRRILLTVATVLTFLAFAANADDAYVSFDKDRNMVVAGPINAIIPKPPGARAVGPVHSTPSFLDEQLKVSLTGFFADNLLVKVQVETTNAGTGTLSNRNYPVRAIAGN